MRVVATTVVRESVYGRQKTGFIYDIDWAAGAVVRRLAIPDPLFPKSDENPRGGLRGGRGVVPTRAGVVVANYDTLYLYDDDWTLEDELSHPLFVGIHEIDWDGRSVWVTATGIDAVLRVSLDGRDATVAWDPHAPHLARRFGLRARPDPIDGSVDYRVRQAPLLDQCHINGIRVDGGSFVVNCGLVRKSAPAPVRLAQRAEARMRPAFRLSARAQPRFQRFAPSMVVRVDEDGRTDTLAELPSSGSPTHNGQLIDDRRLAVNDSTRSALRIFSVPGGREITTVDVPGWLRGLVVVSPNELLVGTGPAIALVDLDAQRVTRRLELSDNPAEAVHGLAVCPPRPERC